MNYPEFPCSKAPLPPGSAPKDGCKCKVCEALRANAKVRERRVVQLQCVSTTSTGRQWHGPWFPVAVERVQS